MTNPFRKTSVASLLAVFTVLVEALSKLAERERDKAQKAQDKINVIVKQRDAAYREADDADHAAKKVQTFLGGAA